MDWTSRYILEKLPVNLALQRKRGVSHSFSMRPPVVQLAVIAIATAIATDFFISFLFGLYLETSV